MSKLPLITVDIAGLVYSSGSEWSEQRRFALRTLKDFGFGKKSMEELIVFEVQKLCKEVEKASSFASASTTNQF